MLSRRLPSVWAFAAALAIVGIFPAIRAPFPALSLDTTLGTVLYLVSMIALGAGGYFADRHARAEAGEVEAERENTAKERHDAFVALQKHFLALQKEHREEDRVRADEGRARDEENRTLLAAMVAKFERGLAAEAKQDQLVAAGRPRSDPALAALAWDASDAWNEVVQMYVNRQQYRSGTAAQLSAAAQMQKSLDDSDTQLPPVEKG
jgi:hypothetical protein